MDEVAADCDTSAFFFGLLGANIADEARIGDGFLGWNLVLVDEEYCVGSGETGANALGKAAELVAGGNLPGVPNIRAMMGD